MKPNIWLLDVDGTLALRQKGGRGPYDWDRVGEDVPNTPVIQIVQGLDLMGKRFIGMSGRHESCRLQTRMWLRHHVFPHGLENSMITLLMRDDRRRSMRDDELKQRLYEEFVRDHYTVEGVIDDRQRVVDMWRGLGLTCVQVAPGDF